jgi:hypothetical protein
MSNAPIPANLPADALGFVAIRPDRPERLAAFMANGALAATFSPDDTSETIAATLAARGLVLREDGSFCRAA